MEYGLQVPDYGILSALTRRLRGLTNLSSIHLVPAPSVGYEAWAAAGRGECDEYNANLGAVGAPIVWRWLQKLLTIGANREDAGFRIGVAGGQTTYGLVENLPEVVTTINVNVAPLVLGAVPRHRYSAGTIAHIFSHRIVPRSESHGQTEPEVRQDSIEVWLRKGGHYVVTLDQSIVGSRDSVDTQSLTQDRIATMGHLNFQYVLVGIGCYKDLVQGSNIAAHIESIYRENPPTGANGEKLCGDICSRLFDRDGKEIDKETQNQFVSVSMKTLKMLVKRKTPVVAIAGGPDKVEAMHAVLRGHMDQPLINGLITDELTATILCDALHDSAPKGTPKRTGNLL